MESTNNTPSMELAKLICEIAKNISANNGFDTAPLKELTSYQKVAARNLMTMINAWSSAMLDELSDGISTRLFFTEVSDTSNNPQVCDGKLNLESIPFPIDFEVKVLLGDVLPIPKTYCELEMLPPYYTSK